MFLVTAEEMRSIEREAIDRIGIPAIVLMENAGRAVAEEARALLRGAKAAGARRWLILAGKGNNGADGAVAARHLRLAGDEADIVYAADPAGFAGEAAAQRDIAAGLGLPSRVYAEGGAPIDWSRYDGVIDALLGTGSRGAPKGAYAALIREANASGLPIVAVDIPSGVDADTGETHDPCIRAARTVALALPKRGHAQYPGKEAAGETVVRPIGLPVGELAERSGVRTFALNEESLRRRLEADPAQERRADSHKGTYGHVLIAAGSRAMSGAGLLCARAALRGGCGLVTWAVPDRLAEPLIGRFPEAMLAPLPDEGRGEWSRVPPEELIRLAAGKDALVLGPGLGRWEGGSAWLRELWERLPGDLPLVLDADALNLLAEASGFAEWPRRPGGVVLTPHPGEMARLAGLSAREVQRDRIGLARRFAERHDVTLALKGAATVVAFPSGDAYVNGNGNAGMATAGAGDVLAGLIGSLLAQGMAPGPAAALGVWRHGAAGDRAAAARGRTASLIAGDIVEEL
ncbi:NAD(P)H-hydrate dehydratase [Cohnella zeiphila]|uniref:Bifunctional NAD(P)H-hydrate repair enzyme n=1 Tax=Cohnella zeiphila TaxID=2761120 RepID=A0A7X0SKJ9_9BACL|nr:NAD(P)H-hydrate dehydratase [Cohnella zeiphila]MBB6730425.1 NAD(P)H-hydrate dehydratase [Cohnella zeiphila]